MVAMTASFQPSVEGCHPVFAVNWAKKYSTMKSSIFPYALEALLEHCQYESSTFIQIVAQYMN